MRSTTIASAILFWGAASTTARMHRIMHRQVSESVTPTPTGTIQAKSSGIPYPTGPGYDIPLLASITANSPAEPTVPLVATFAAGSTPVPLGGKVALPDLTTIDFSQYPPLDKPPPTDSAFVQQWLKELENATIPSYAPLANVSCDANTDILATAGADGRCWWTCSGGCTRPTDIVGCSEEDRWGLTFDDGPSPYTPKLLAYLESIDTKATFFVVGSRVISRPEIVQTELMLGHELSIHTWSHTALTTQSNAEIVAELGWTRKAIKDVTGVTPLTFRPPFGDIDDRVRAVATAMGLTPIIWTQADATHKADTFDYDVAGGIDTAEESLSQFRVSLSMIETTMDTGVITLEHDLFQEAIDLAIGFTIPDALSRSGPTGTGWRLGNVAQCLGRDAVNSYLETATNSTLLAGINARVIADTQTTAAVASATPTGSLGEDTYSQVVENGVTTYLLGKPIDTIGAQALQTNGQFFGPDLNSASNLSHQKSLLGLLGILSVVVMIL